MLYADDAEDAVGETMLEKEAESWPLLVSEDVCEPECDGVEERHLEGVGLYV